MVYLLGLVAAVLLAVGFVLQHHAAEAEPPSLRLSPRLLLDLAARPRWLLGIAAMIAGQLVGAVALSRGAVTLVEPLLAANLLFALPLTALYHRRRVRLFDVGGGLILVTGLAVFVASARPDGGSPRTPDFIAWTAAFAALAVALVGLLVAQRGRSAVTTAALLGIGAGLLFGMQDTLTRGADELAGDGIAALFANWVPYVLLAVGMTGLLLAQSAFEAAPLSASLPAITAAEPLAGIALGIGLYGEQIRTTPLALLGETLGLVAIVAGIIVVGRSPVVTGEHRDGADGADTADTRGVRIRIEGVDLPGGDGVHVAVQRRDHPDELLGLTPGDAAAATWILDCEVVRSADGFDVKGPYVQGPCDGRFIYLSWVTVDGTDDIQMFRRAKLWLDCVPGDVMEDAVQQGLLVGRLPLKDAKGSPLCASVRPPVIDWSAASARNGQQPSGA